MAKSGKITKQEIFYIQQNPENLTIHELAKELDRTPKTVATYYIEPEQVKEEEPQKPVADKDSPMFKLMGRHKRGEQNVATVMTKAASQLADETRPKGDRLGKLKSAIHKPRG